VDHTVGIHPILALPLSAGIRTRRRELLSSISRKLAPEEEEEVHEEAEVEEVLVGEVTLRPTLRQLQE